MFPIKKIIKIDRDNGEKTNLGCHLVSFRDGDHTLGFQIKGRETIALVFAHPHVFFFFSILTKLRDKINVLSKITHFGADFARFRGAFFSTTHYLLAFNERQKKSKRGM